MTSNERAVRIEASWKQALAEEFAKPYMTDLRAFLAGEKQQGKILYPAGDDIFNAFDSTPVDAVKVVILGQDPYHGPGQAHGLAFSVRPGVALPPSLQNIYKEIAADLRLPPPPSGCLQAWATQGVLLLNSVLTVEQGNAGSHQGKGWERFTDEAIRVLAERREGLVFLLWGSYAIRKGQLIDRNRHLVLTAPHPSPLSAHRGFLGCRHFSQANAYLAQRGQKPIDWTMSQVDDGQCEVV